MATAMPAAIRPYSMAVAPDASLTKRATVVLIFGTPFVLNSKLFAGAKKNEASPARSSELDPDVA
jgi:hypothetical protein